jgi:phosphonate transport system permease protein
MSHGLLTLPETQLEPLLRAYAHARLKRRAQILLATVLLLGAIFLSAITAEVRVDTLFAHIDRLSGYFARIFYLENHQPVWTDSAEWFWGLKKWLRLIGETLVIAYLGTIIGALGAFVLCFFAAANLAVSQVLRWFAVRFLEFCRTVPELVFALLFVASFGLGPLPGILALAIHTLGALGKQYSEVVENADMRPFEGVTATGATWPESVRFAILPQVLSNFASYGLLRFEINVRESAIIGFVGAGGIGQDLLVAVRRFYYSDVSAIVLLIIAMVAVIDLSTERVRRYFIGREQSS